MRYRTKVVEKEAIQWTGKNLQQIMDFAGPAVGPIERRPDYKLKIETLEGVMAADINDYIIKGLCGEFYPCKPDIFHKTYELVEEFKKHPHFICRLCGQGTGTPYPGACVSQLGKDCEWILTD